LTIAVFNSPDTNPVIVSSSVDGKRFAAAITSGKRTST